MFFRALLILLFFTVCNTSALRCAPDQQDAEHENLLASIRSRAVEYESTLKNLVCRQVVVRNKKSSNGSEWKRTDTSEWEVTYADGRESRKVLSVNGKPKNKMEMRQGFVPGGEFASVFRNAFDPRVGTEFTWDHQEAGSSPVCVFRLRVPQNTSRLISYETHNFKKSRVKLGFRGLLYSDCKTGVITRLQLTSDLLPEERVSENIDIRYRLTPIGDAAFMLPSEVEETVQTRNDAPTKVNIEFLQFRRFTVESTIRLQ